mgnify:CR=1 FL=1
MIDDKFIVIIITSVLFNDDVFIIRFIMSVSAIYMVIFSCCHCLKYLFWSYDYVIVVAIEIEMMSFYQT